MLVVFELVSRTVFGPGFGSKSGRMGESKPDSCIFMTDSEEEITKLHKNLTLRAEEGISSIKLSPSILFVRFPESLSHNLIVVSLDPLRMYVPSGEKATDLMQSL